jgi:hypothetical protein
MSDLTPGDRFPLQLYHFAVSRYRRPAMLLALLLLGLWFPVSLDLLPWPKPPEDVWLLAGGFVSAAFWLFVLIGPRLAYVQPRGDHLRLQTPIYRLKVSYRRILNTRAVELAKLLPPSSLSSGKRRLLAPFYNRTALGIDLEGYPLHPLLMRLFLHDLFFAPGRPGLVLIVPDWMRLSNQLSDRLQVWRESRRHRSARSDAAAILDESAQD